MHAMEPFRGRCPSAEVINTITLDEYMAKNLHIYGCIRLRPHSRCYINAQV